MTKKHQSPSKPLAATAIAVCTFGLDGHSDSAMQLFPAGTFDAPRGALRGQGPWRLDAAAAQRLIATVAQRTNDIVIDYEHQSLLTAQNGKPVVAAGWIGPQTLEWREPPAAHPGLFAINPKLTAAASGHIAADEIRYVSPVFTYDAKTGEVLDIINVALTNNPAIDGMQALTVAATSLLAANALLTPTESTMDIDELLEQLRWMFNLPVLATVAEIKAELDKASALLSSNAADAAATSLVDHLAAKNAQIAALTAQVGTATEQVSTTPDPAKYVPIEVVNELNGKLAALSGDTVEMQVEKLIEEGVKTGRIIGAASKQWLTDMGKKDITSLQSYLDSAQPIAALSGMQTGGKSPIPGDGIAALSASAEEIAVAKQLGLETDDVIKQRRK